MIINLNSETHPQAEIVAILLNNNSVDFKWVSGPYGGVCNTPLLADFSETIPTVEDLAAAISAVLGEAAPLP